MVNYQVNWKYKPFLFLIDLIGNILFIYRKLFKRGLKKEGIKKILIVRIDEIGDVILTTPLLKTLRNGFKDAEISVLIKSSTKELLENNPDINKTYVCKYPWLKEKFRLNYFIKLMEELKKENFDLVIELHPDPRNILLAFLIGKYRIGYGFRGLGFLLDKEIKYDPNMHIIDANLEVAKALGIKRLYREVSMGYSKKEDRYANNLFRKNKIRNKFICINPGTGRISKTWIEERWAKLAEELINKYKIRVIFTGSLREETYINSILNLIKEKRIKKNIINLAGRTSLRQLAAVYKKALFVIAPDSGPLHIARAVKTPLIGLYGPVDPKIWGYCSRRYRCIYKSRDCLLCKGKYESDVNKRCECMSRIEVSDIMHEIALAGWLNEKI